MIHDNLEGAVKTTLPRLLLIPPWQFMTPRTPYSGPIASAGEFEFA